MTVVEADLLSLRDDELVARVRGCDAVLSCLGHVISVRGVFGPPRDLVTRATSRLCRAIRDSRPAAPVRYVLMTSVSVDHPGGSEARRGGLERALLWALRGTVPPVRDNQRAADYLHREIGPGDPLVQWVVVRPDTLLEGDVSAYALHEHLVNTLFKAGSTRMANVAHFMCELATDDASWHRWAGRLPVIVDQPGAGA